MPQIAEIKRRAPAAPEKKSGWDTFLERLAFWKIAKRNKAERAFIDAVNKRNAEWARKRAARQANQI